MASSKSELVPGVLTRFLLGTAIWVNYAVFIYSTLLGKPLQVGLRLVVLYKQGFFCPLVYVVCTYCTPQEWTDVKRE